MAKVTKTKTKTKAKNNKLHTNDIANQIKSIDFHYYLNIDYDIERHCDDFCDPYCRCGKLTNVRIEPFNSQTYHNIAEKIIRSLSTKKNPMSDIDKYCIERLVLGFKVEDFEVSTVGGYYGEEIGSINIVWYGNSNEIPLRIETCLGLKNDDEKIKYLLIAEYGYVLEVFKKKSFKIDTIRFEDIEFKNENYYIKLNNPNMYFDTIDKNDILGLVLKLDMGLYRLLDGYHRSLAFENKFCQKTKRVNAKYIVAY